MKKLIVLGTFLVCLLSPYMMWAARPANRLLMGIPLTVTAMPQDRVGFGTDSVQQSGSGEMEDVLGKIAIEKVRSYVEAEQLITGDFDKWIYAILGLFALAVLVGKLVKKKTKAGGESVVWLILQVALFAVACIGQTVFVRYGLNSFFNSWKSTSDYGFVFILQFIGIGLAMLVIAIVEYKGAKAVLRNIGEYAGIRKNYTVSIVSWVVYVSAVLLIAAVKPAYIQVVIYVCVGLVVLDLVVTIIKGRKNILWLSVSLLMYIICFISAIQYYAYAVLFIFWVGVSLLVVILFVICQNFSLFVSHTVNVIDYLGRKIGHMRIYEIGGIVKGFTKVNDDTYMLTDNNYKHKVQQDE